MNTQAQAYINGFIKRAAEYGISEKIALDFFNNQNTNKEKNNSFKYNIQDIVGTGGFGGNVKPTAPMQPRGFNPYGTGMGIPRQPGTNYLNIDMGIGRPRPTGQPRFGPFENIVRPRPIIAMQPRGFNPYGTGMGIPRQPGTNYLNIDMGIGRPRPTGQPISPRTEDLSYGYDYGYDKKPVAPVSNTGSTGQPIAPRTEDLSYGANSTPAPTDKVLTNRPTDKSKWLIEQ